MVNAAEIDEANQLERLTQPTETQAPPATAAEVDSSPFPWLASLNNTLNDLNQVTQLCNVLLQIRADGQLPSVSLYVADPVAQENSQPGEPVPHYSIPWTWGLSQLEPTDLTRLFWQPLMTSLQARIAKLMLDVGELNKFVHMG